jgi:hypothetical protein
MASVSDEDLKQLLALAQQDAKRKIDWPNDWRPYEVNNPEDGQPFTNESAWELIIRLLEDKAPAKKVEQKNPPGAVAFVFQKTLADGHKVYIKIRFNKNRSKVFGRSFHYDESQISKTQK